MITQATLLIALASTGSLGLGEKAPQASLKMKNVDGKELSLADVGAGKKATLVVFTCNHCPYAKAWEQRIVELGNTYAKQGVGVVLVNPNDPKVQAEDRMEVMQERAKSRGMTFPYVADSTSEVARAFGATKTPEVFLFDAGGQLVYKGAVDDNSEDPAKVKETYLKNAVDALLAGKPIANKETKALGCGIKFVAAK